MYVVCVYVFFTVCYFSFLNKTMITNSREITSWSPCAGVVAQLCCWKLAALETGSGGSGQSRQRRFRAVTAAVRAFTAAAVQGSHSRGGSVTAAAVQGSHGRGGSGSHSRGGSGLRQRRFSHGSGGSEQTRPRRFRTVTAAAV